MSQKLITRDPEILGGTPVFSGTRVPIRILFEHLKTGDSLDVFLDDFPCATHEQASALLDLALEQLSGLNKAAA